MPGLALNKRLNLRKKLGPIPAVLGGAGASHGIQLSSATFAAGAPQGSPIGALSVAGGTGTYTFTLTNSASNQAQLAGTNGVNLQAGSAAAGVGSFSVSVHADNGAGSTFDRTFLITALAYVPTYYFLGF